MTCVLAIEDGPHVWLAGDSAVTDDDYNQELLSDSKVWATATGWGFGFAGSNRVGAVLRETLDPPKMRRDLSRIRRYVTIELAKELRALLRDEEETEIAATYLIAAHRGFAWGGALREMSRTTHGYQAIGTPDALAVLAATDKLSPRVRALRVLACVARHAANVRPPFTVVRV